MTTANDNAFPKSVSGYQGHQGLTKREYFAAMALTDLASCDLSPEDVAKEAVAIADALIIALNKEVQP